ncbi:MAG: DUF502 domain-containing protein [Candidatus Zixiibacteriota bacterium]
MSIFRIIKAILKRQFLSGVLVVVPVILTYVVLRFLFESLDGILSPVVYKTLGYDIPGLGIFLTILLILLTGFFTRSLIGSSIYKQGDKILARLPLIRVIYLAAKQLINAITMPNIKTFKEVVLIEYMRKDLYAIGFATSDIKCNNLPIKEDRLISVFIPSTPTPVSGFLVFVPQRDIVVLDMSIEEAMKLLVSGGIVSPEQLLGKVISGKAKLGEENASG